MAASTSETGAGPEGRSLRILLVEDREDDALLVTRELERIGHELTWKRVDSGDAMRAALAGTHWDVIISDFSLPGFSAIDALELRQRHAPDVPFIIVSGTIDEETAVEALRLGADDFITKGRLARLGPAVLRSLRDFEARQARRTAEARLQQAQKMELVGQLAGGVAHDFNNLLGVIQGYGELLVKRLRADEVSRHRLGHILEAARRGAALTRQLLAFGRQQPLEARALDLNAVVAGMEPMFRRLISEDVEIVTALDEGLHRVYADPTHIEQVLLNLAVNARDAMPGGGRLTIETGNVELDEAYATTHPEVTPGHYAVLAVSDTGHGMDAETLSRVFEPFYTTKESGKGTGLGLATVYGIVRQNGGHVSVYSEVGRGTSFKVLLPRTRLAATTRPSTPAAAAHRANGETVVLVEDEPALRQVIRELLQEGGYTVIDGPSPEAALEAAAAHSGPIHLLLTDLVMPRLSGREAAERMTRMRPGVKVLFMSGYANAAAGHHGGLPESHVFLAKPFSFDTLLRKVREVLDSEPGERT
jgi:signal transduction histidine kinase